MKTVREKNFTSEFHRKSELIITEESVGIMVTVECLLFVYFY